ncbi:P1 family peptidase [Rossellomorea marisflavi]|uniref:DmpA family aminopeptidase n=1 Tax=Rossellomorea marisflavi TaxID=189381 RepID=UPI0006F98B9B|nr:P1 family peptidase [Rossellomorea marisflavi]KQU60065.1 aminopeptidase [Bacillus sp. Leaf406]MDW4526831.1 P1 family peptidase [Rossellomorea marisflavi]UKS63555.1 P1 family peptidase [Rossellomorea marisflavi]WJV21020.1 P1 family peptidase [Rossellomorea marisflavi]
MTRRIRDYGVKIGRMQTGEDNSITDVKGVTVGHTTIDDGPHQTGVTAILPHHGSLFKDKLIASSHVINGFGKSMGLIQINELGTLETPIILTNTLSIGVAADALIDYMLEHNPEIGRTTGTVNPIVCECNDMLLNDVRGKVVRKEHVLNAIHNAEEQVEEGSVGAGRGMLCYSLKGGIGTSSRMIPLDHGTYTLGVLVLSNFGILSDLKVGGNPVGEKLKQAILQERDERDKGSIIIVVATDLPVSERQLHRIIKRSVTGLSRTGSIITTGSGEVVIGFSTHTTIPHHPSGKLLSIPVIHEEDMDIAFRAVGEATEEAVLNSLVAATHVIGRDGNERPAFKDLINKYDIPLV